MPFSRRDGDWFRVFESKQLAALGKQVTYSKVAIKALRADVRAVKATLSIIEAKLKIDETVIVKTKVKADIEGSDGS